MFGGYDENYGTKTLNRSIFIFDFTTEDFKVIKD